MQTTTATYVINVTTEDEKRGYILQDDAYETEDIEGSKITER